MAKYINEVKRWQKLANILTEAVEVPSWLAGKLEDVHIKPGQGSIFAKSINDVLKLAQDALDKEQNIDKIANSIGTLTIKSPGIGYNLVLPIDKAKALPGAKESEVEKVEGPNRIKVPAITTTAPMDQFKTDELTVIVRPKKDKSGAIIPNEYIVLSAFPGDPSIPRASEWGGKYAVIIPSNKLEEGALILTPEERQQVEAMIPIIIDNIKKPLLPNDKVYDIGNIKYKFADGEDGEAKVVVGYPGSDNAKGVFRTHDPKNRTDNWIVINQVYFSQFFPSSNSFSDLDQRLSRTVTGNENTGIERLRQTLKHELIHAKDPALNHHYLKEPYSNKDEAIYYKSWTEFQTFTGQFFESLISGTDRVLNNADNPEDIKKIEKALSNILQYFAGKTKTINLDTKEFIDGTGSRNFFQKIFNFLNQIVRMPKDSDYALSEYLTYLAKIKQYNPEGYKEFLKDLYKTIKSIEEKVNSVSDTKIKVQEMKQNINEIKRMQQLAGLLIEAEGEEINNDKAAAALNAAFKTQDVAAFVNQFKTIASDPKVQAILKAGETDGNPADEKITYGKGQVAVKGLLPTQAEIGFDQSIANILTDQYGSLQSILDGNANVGGPIVTYNGKYIIDGHHRWSQVYAANPNASMENLDIKGKLSPTEILKIVHAAIAAKIGEVPSADPKGINILNGVAEKQVLDAVNSKLSDKAKQIWASKGQKDNTAVAKYIYGNLKQLISKNKPVAGAPGRKDMPQTDQGGAATDKLALLQKGIINFNDPKSSDIKNAQAVKEIKRLQQLAGILNEEYRKKLEEIVLEGEDKNLVTDPKILALAAKITKQSVDKVEDKVDAVLTGKEEEIKESLGITVALALPMIIEAGGSLAGWINKKYGLSKEELVEYKKWQSEYSKLKKTVDSYSDSIKLTDPKTKQYVDNKKAELAKMKQEGSEKFGGKLSKLLKEAGHGLHSIYTSPIRALLWTISLFTPKGSDLKNPKIREKIANIIYAAGMIGFAGYGIFHSIQHLAGVSEAATAIIDGVKGGKSVSEIVTDIPVVAKAFAT
jgi:uncharacterized protein YnzC (UPF0291/DUF896 family)